MAQPTKEDRIQLYLTKHNFPLEAAIWAAEHEDLPEFRELKFTPETGLVLSEKQVKRDPETFDKKPVPPFISRSLYNKIVRFYFKESLSTRDCARLLRMTEQEVKIIISKLKNWAKIEKTFRCKSCEKHYEMSQEVSGRVCMTCYSKRMTEVYK